MFAAHLRGMPLSRQPCSALAGAASCAVCPGPPNCAAAAEFDAPVADVCCRPCPSSSAVRWPSAASRCIRTAKHTAAKNAQLMYLRPESLLSKLPETSRPPLRGIFALKTRVLRVAMHSGLQCPAPKKLAPACTTDKTGQRTGLGYKPKPPAEPHTPPHRTTRTPSATPLHSSCHSWPLIIAAAATCSHCLLERGKLFLQRLPLCLQEAPPLLAQRARRLPATRRGVS